MPKHEMRISANDPPDKRATNILGFPPDLAEKLGFYVYRLIDPRNGQTFYVGKGCGNRVFQHQNGISPEKWEKSDDETKTDNLDSVSAKIRTILSIKNESLDVWAVIHRHGLTNREALEVEAALIDAYPGLANVQNGHGSADRGCISADQLIRNAQATEADLGQRKLVIIKIRSSVIEAKSGVYEAVRSSWKINETKAKDRPVLAVENGIIRGVFSAEWHLADGGPRKEFDGASIEEPWAKKLIGKRIPAKYRGKAEANPVRYVN